MKIIVVVAVLVMLIVLSTTLWVFGGAGGRMVCLFLEKVQNIQYNTDDQCISTVHHAQTCRHSNLAAMCGDRYLHYI